MAQPQRLVLVHVADVHVAHALDLVGIGVLAALAQQGDQFGIGREVVLDDLLLTAVDDDDLVSSTGQALFDDVLDGRTIDDEQHFLRLCFRGRQKPRAEPCSRNESLHDDPSLYRIGECCPYYATGTPPANAPGPAAEPWRRTR